MDRQAGAQIEITSEMAFAGGEIIFSWAECCGDDALARRVYIAMEEARLAPTIPLGDVEKVAE